MPGWPHCHHGYNMDRKVVISRNQRNEMQLLSLPWSLKPWPSHFIFPGSQFSIFRICVIWTRQEIRFITADPEVKISSWLLWATSSAWMLQLPSFQRQNRFQARVTDSCHMWVSETKWQRRAPKGRVSNHTQPAVTCECQRANGRGGPPESVTTQGSSPHLGFTGLAALDFSCVRGAFGKSISAKPFFFFRNIYWYLRKQETDNRSKT